MEELFELGWGVKLPNNPHRRALQILRVQRAQNTTHEHIIPLIDMDNLMMLVRELVDCVNLCASRDLDLNSHVPLSDDVKDTECSFQHLLNNVLVFLIFVVIITLFIFFVKKLGFN